MDGESKTALTTVAVTLIVAGFFLGLTWINHINEKNFIDGGFTRESLPGQNQVQWVKK